METCDDNGPISMMITKILIDPHAGEIPQHLIDEYKKESEEKGKATFEFAWVMDRFNFTSLYMSMSFTTCLPFM